jgi:hypothetical protein
MRSYLDVSRPTSEEGFAKILMGVITNYVLQFPWEIVSYLRRNSIYKSLRRGHKCEDSVVGFTENFLYCMERYKGFSGARRGCSLHVNKTERVSLELLTNDQE